MVESPRGTKSYAIIIFDPDVPINRATMNTENAPIPAAEPRRVFYHFLVADISTKVTSLAEGAASNARVVRGMPASQVRIGVTGLKDFDPVFASNDAMKGKYYGYYGTCPPWNDRVPHHYHFTVYALSVPKLEFKEGFNGTDMMAALKDKVLAQGEAVGFYSTNPDVIAKLPK